MLERSGTYLVDGVNGCGLGSVFPQVRPAFVKTMRHFWNWFSLGHPWWSVCHCMTPKWCSISVIMSWRESMCSGGDRWPRGREQTGCVAWFQPVRLYPCPATASSDEWVSLHSHVSAFVLLFFFLFFFCSRVHLPRFVSHCTTSSLVEWSLDKLPSRFITCHESTSETSSGSCHSSTDLLIFLHMRY